MAWTGISALLLPTRSLSGARSSEGRSGGMSSPSWPQRTARSRPAIHFPTRPPGSSFLWETACGESITRRICSCPSS